MKLDGVTMETTEPTEAAGVSEQLPSQDNITEQVPLQPEEAAPEAASKANGKPTEADPKVKPKAVGTKTQPTIKSTVSSGSISRPAPASHRMVNDVKSSNNVSAVGVKKTTTTAKTSAAGAVPKRPLGVAAVSTTVKNQTRVPEKKPTGPTRTTSVAAATVTNGTKSTAVNGTPKKRPAAETVNVAKPKTTGTTNRPLASTAPKPSTTTTTKVGGAAVSKTTRPATAPSTSRPVATTSRPTTATTKPSTAATAKTTVSRVTTATSTGRTTAAQPPKTAAAKKDVSRPPSAAVAKKPATATSSAVPKKPEPSKPAATVKLNSAFKWSATAKTTDSKVLQSKTQQAVKPPTKKPAAPVKFTGLNKPPLGRTPPSSPANKSANGSTSQAKRGAKPTQAVPPFTSIKKTRDSNDTTPSVEAQSAAGTAVAAATAVTVLAETQEEATVALPQCPILAASTPEEVSATVLSQEVVPQESVQSQVSAPSPQQSPVRIALPQTSPPHEQLESCASLLTMQEQIPDPGEQTLPPVASPLNLSEEPVYLSTDQTPSTSKSLPTAANASLRIVPPTNLNEEEDEEEREGSQLVSVSEMSGTTQPTEESRPESAGLVSGSAWRASGALLSELDSEDVSGSQQGASELSAPGVLEGTESMDDLGDGSLKGAIDMEGASAGSPDFEKVPDIPVNDFDEEEDDDDDNDRVCDMDVGSEQTDEPQRPRHDNDVDEEEEDDDDDDDVEMASEGVTESGLESYGNADEDDFAEDERLDNLNRVVQPPPPPPLLPSAPAAQWDQPNPFADPWAEPVLQQQQQVLEHIFQPEQMAGAAAASALADPWQADSETPTQTPAQAWLELGTAPCVSEEIPHHSSCKEKPHNLEDQMYLDQSSPVPMQSLAPAHLSAPGMSLSSTLSSETSTPEELGDYNQVEKFQAQDSQGSCLSPQPDVVCQNLESEDGQREEEAEAKTLPADEVLGGPATAPTSNPSSSSVTEDEASDTEGEAQLNDSLESSAVSNITFDNQAPAQRCLSTVEEGEEAEEEDVDCGVGEDTTPPSATSLASYGFDTMTTTSNSHAQSSGESCIKSPGIFSLEELPEEAKEPCLAAQPHIQPCLAEQQYIECGKQEAELAEHVGDEAPGSDEALDPSMTLSASQQQEEIPDDIQPPYYSAICEKTENFFAGFTALPHPHRRDHSAHPRTYCDIIKPHSAAATAPKLTCADLPPRSPGQKALSPQLRRLEQHQKQLLELQQRREQQSRPLEEAEQERKRREEEEQRKKKEEAEEEIKRNKEEEERKMREQAELKKKEEEEKVKKEELKQRRDLELQLQQQQQELKQRQQIMQWQQELQQSNKGQTVLLSPSSGLCTIYEALENSDEEAEGKEEGINELNATKRKKAHKREISETVMPDKDKHQDSLPYTEKPPPHPDSSQTPNNPSQDDDDSSPCPPESPERPPPLDLEWGKKVDIVQQLINQTLLLNRDGCSSLLLLPGGAGGTLSPLESSLWPSLLPPLTPPSATVTSVSSFSPEATGSSPQGEWTVVELETHH